MLFPSTGRRDARGMLTSPPRPPTILTPTDLFLFCSSIRFIFYSVAMGSLVTILTLHCVLQVHICISSRRVVDMLHPTYIGHQFATWSGAQAPFQLAGFTPIRRLKLDFEVVIPHHPINPLRGLYLDFGPSIPHQSKLHYQPPRPAYLPVWRTRFLRPAHLPVSGQPDLCRQIPDCAVQES